MVGGARRGTWVGYARARVLDARVKLLPEYDNLLQTISTRLIDQLLFVDK